ncbi:hypothetical protein NJT12_14240 [Flavobacterium sp. AC]|uniref:DUF4365 domain-containing protein n=1 Tax=Flavobacterium azizsancarii TaxID=2961580 RepID=A0ABT4WEA1_9FLAO|nr:hypothetical protein [Flavobacterium azizsancarii]MDA6070775.1 hypothetical protein [Flavobacterium azizsancarii]
MSKSSKVSTALTSYTLEELLRKRTGGAVNFRGINYQMLYSCHLLLAQLADSNSTTTIRLEGIEDVDLIRPALTLDSHNYIQLKSSENKINAADFWAMGVLQNFIPIYLADLQSTFRLVYNFKIAEGLLQELFDSRLSNRAFEHWQKKIKLVYENEFNIVDFLQRITFEKHTISELTQEINGHLYKNWNVNRGTEMQFISGLSYHVLQWSQKRQTIGYENLALLFTDINDTFSKAPINEAIKHKWIEPVDYLNSSAGNDSHYYDGKAAQPYHIASGLPARRKFWEKEIYDTLKLSDVVIIRSSSGQGKSTLAWQVSYNLCPQHTVYRISSVRNHEQANSITEFMESRVAIGQYPLVVVDGLSSALEYWAHLVELTAQLPVKYIITSRHEDWIRYGSDISRIAVRHIDISLSPEEAREIFKQFSNKGKIHPDISQWQPVWEQVSQRGLLIEYTFLLTRGQMIHERIDAQIKTLNQRIGAAAKIEILRMVSLADSMNIKINTSQLLEYIASSTGFTQDRGEVLSELQDEYFLNFENTFIEGLHPVRSIHMRDILHRSLSLSESLINLYPILDQSDTEDFFIAAPLLLGQTDRKAFYRQMAGMLKERPYIAIANALDGITHGEPQKYWIENKHVYDRAFQKGGILLFTLHTIPGLNLNTFESLISIVPQGMRKNLEYYVEILKELPPYNPDTTDVCYFAEMLKEALATRTVQAISYSGLDDLSKWFGKLKLDISFLHLFDPKALHANLPAMPLEEAKGLMQFHRIFHPAKFQDFTKKHKTYIINYLRRTTNTLSIKQEGKDILLEYIIDGTENIPANDLSVNRIEIVFNFLPFFKMYKATALMLPYPSREIVEHTLRDSQKSMSPQNITDRFESRYNRIWTDTIEKNYEVSSAYQWQKNMLDIRDIAIEWVRNLLKITDAKFEANASKHHGALKAFEISREKLGTSINPEKPYPSYGRKMTDSKHRANMEKPIKKWINSLNNSNNQVYSLFSPKGDNDRNVACINLKAAFFNLEQMQEAFHEMEKLTIAYFDSDSRDRQENILYTRLYQSVLYTMAHLPIEEQPKVAVAKKAIELWYRNFMLNRLHQLSFILDTTSQITGISLTAPKQFIETETLITVPIAIEGIDFRNEEYLIKILAALSPLAGYPATFFTLVSVSNNTITNAVRASRDFFISMEQFLTSGNNKALKMEYIYPILPTDELLPCFPGLKIIPMQANEKTEKKAQVVMELWKLNQATKTLDTHQAFDKSWLLDIRDSSQRKITTYLAEAKIDKESEFTTWVNNTLGSGRTKSENDFLHKIIEITQEQAANNMPFS